MRRAEAELRNGRSIPEVCSIIGVDEQIFREWAVTIPRRGEQLSNSPLLDAVCALFFVPHEKERMEQVGSGVLISLFDDIFLLTAAHVTDLKATGELYIPGRSQIVPINGHFAHNPIPSGSKRTEDRLDSSYFRLALDLRANLHQSIRPLLPDDLDPFDRPSERDYYTFVGYPWRKSKQCGTSQESERFTFSGEIVPHRVYERFGYSTESHFLIRFRRNKAFSSRYRSLGASPHPQGISGGAIFAWPKEVDNEPDIPPLKLVGICHTYIAEEHLMVGTHVGVYLCAIQNNNPHLPIFETN